eukprot:Blabericola_migrator_1__10102@NODE_560_length_7594_cov_42_214694_g420_i0_p6_GENE_NODE_560_length_7594_cov_42_214694_g420_i0NODE_560_length_7594_cov_42_214694_g420_i0_p6_ORF_typecomplete_len193_score22_22_NODE_560_length_7594_cov_42_214694_g420_i022502828
MQAMMFAFNVESARVTEREQRDEHRAHCLCELESFLFGMPLGKPAHPPVQTLMHMDEPMPLPPPPPVAALERPSQEPRGWGPQMIRNEQSPYHAYSTEWQPSNALHAPTAYECASQRSRASEATTSEGAYGTRSVQLRHEYGGDSYRRSDLPPRRPSPQLAATPSLHSESHLPSRLDHRLMMMRPSSEHMDG